MFFNVVYWNMHVSANPCYLQTIFFQSIVVFMKVLTVLYHMRIMWHLLAERSTVKQNSSYSYMIIGDTAQRPRLESTAEEKGLEPAHIDELQLPANQVAISLKASDVKHSAIGVAWSLCGKFSTIAALAEICNTLPGIRGYIANVSSLGVRVEHKHVALARQALQLPIGSPFRFMLRFGSVGFGPATVHVGSVRAVRLGSRGHWKSRVIKGSWVLPANMGTVWGPSKYSGTSLREFHLAKRHLIWRFPKMVVTTPFFF